MTRFQTYNLKKIRKIIFCIAFPLLVGAVSALLSGAMDGFDASLRQPPLSPPGWLFPLVWTVLYILMGICSYIVYESGAPQESIKKAQTFYYMQLAFNFFWSIFFFGFELYAFSFFWLLALLVLTVITAVRFYAQKSSAGYLMLPYIAWLTFAAYLNFAIWILN